MRNRWTILAVLFVTRAAFVFQFGSVGVLGPSLADIGTLIGRHVPWQCQWRAGLRRSRAPGLPSQFCGSSAISLLAGAGLPSIDVIAEAKLLVSTVEKLVTRDRNTGG